MAIIKLTDIVTVMKSKWTFGDKIFGFTEEFNDNHNTQYPSLLITPPTSVFPEVGVNNGWEEYTFEVYFSELYNRTQQQNESIDQRWENLQDLATQWLDDFLKHYQADIPSPAPIQAFLQDESLTLERVKEVANDQLIQIRMTFTWRVFSKCFRPVSPAPDIIPNLAIWLRADSSTTFSIPTKKVSAWGEQSGNNNNVSQSTTANQPLRYTYDGAKDKTRIQFNGTSDSFVSDSNNPISNTELTMFTVAQANKVTPAFANTYSTRFEAGTDVVSCGNPPGGAGGQLFSFTDGANTDQPFSASSWVCLDPTAPWRGIIEKNETGQEEWKLHAQYSSGYMYFYLYDNVAGGNIYSRVLTTFPKGEWVHVVGTYDGSNTAAGMKIYYDGVLQALSTGGGGTYNGMQLTTSNLDIGNGGGNSYSGQLDEVSMFDKELTQAEVTELYNLGNPSDLSTATPNANMIGWWRMGDGATFPTIPDDSTNNNAGTMSGALSAASFEQWCPTSEKGAYYSYANGNIMISLGSNSSRPYVRLNDSAQAAGEWNVRINREVANDTNNYHILTAYLDASDISLQTNNNTAMTAALDSGWGSPTFNAATFEVGNGANLGYLDGNIQEVIIYNRALNSFEIAKVKDYLNKKYKIY